MAMSNNNEPGARIIRWFAADSQDLQMAENEIASLEAHGWIFRGMAGAGAGNPVQGGYCEFSVLYVKPALEIDHE